VNSYSVAERINSDVNASVSYKTDLQQYGTLQTKTPKIGRLLKIQASNFKVFFKN